MSHFFDLKVENTFLHVVEPREITPRSNFTRSCNDATPGHTNPRAHMWAGCQLESAADKSSSCGAEPEYGSTLQGHMVVMKACQKSRDLVGAVQCYSSLLRQNIVPDAQVFTILIDICAKTGACEEAEMWMCNMIDCSIPPGRVAFNCLINACAKARNGALAEKWLKAMTKRGLEPDLMAYNCLI